MSTFESSALDELLVLLAPTWPQLVAGVDESLPPSEGGPVIELYGVPDGQTREIQQALLRLPAHPVLDHLPIVVHSVRATREHYPDAWHHYCVKQFFLSEMSEVIDPADVEIWRLTHATETAESVDVDATFDDLQSLPQAA